MERHEYTTGSAEQSELAVQTLRAIRGGEVDAVVVTEDPRSPVVYTLQTADRPYRLMVETMLEGAAVVGSNGLILFANRRLGALLGRPLEQLTGSRINDYENAPTDGDRLDMLVHSTDDARGTVALRAADGNRLDMLVSATKLPGSLVSETCLIFTDLTELEAKRREVALLNEQLAQRVTESESQLRELADNSSAAIYIKDLDGCYLMVNREVERLFGLGREEIVGSRALHCVPHHALDAWHENDLRAARARAPIQVEESLPLEDREHVVLSVKFPLMDAGGRIYAVAGISTDITERKRIENEVHRLNRTLTTALQELDSFAFSVSHDLRAPLRAISGFSGLLLQDYDDKLDARGKHFLERVNTSVSEMEAMIEALLRLSRVTRAELRREPVDLTALARLVLSELRTNEPDRKVDVVIAEGMTASADPQMIRQVLANLLGNAWKFTARQPDATIEFGRRSTTEGEVFFVRDNGAGFDMAHAEKLFAPFQRFHDESELAGEGIEPFRVTIAGVV